MPRLSSSGKNQSKQKKGNTGRRNQRQFGRGGKPRSLAIPIVIAIIVIIVIAVGVYYATSGHSTQSTSSSGTTVFNPENKPVILYVNQGNAYVGQNSFANLTKFALDHKFNTIFFQIYNAGDLIFNGSALNYFVLNAHLFHLSIYFALYFTKPNQTIPSSIYSYHEDGISLDMSTLPNTTQTNLLSTLQQNYQSGKTAVTTYNFNTKLKPDLLIFETYTNSTTQYIHSGVIASVEVAQTTSKANYLSQLNYVLDNSNGVMVFDYYGLLKSGY